MFQNTFDVNSLNGTNGFVIMSGDGTTENLGSTVQNLGDVNGDGIGDIAIGSPNSASSGKVYVVYGQTGPFQQTLYTSFLNGQNGFTITGSDYLGRVVFNIGDFNGDGLSDIGMCDQQQIYVVYGSRTLPPEFDISQLNGLNGFSIINAMSSSGCSLRQISGAGDFNGDGFKDIAISNTNMDETDNLCGTSACYGGNNDMGTSKIYMIYGQYNMNVQIDVNYLNGQNGFTITGAYPGDFAGISISNAGDFNGDGYGDLVIGAPCSPIPGVPGPGNCQGLTYIVHGSKNYPERLPITEVNTSISACSVDVFMSGYNCAYDVGSVDVYGNDSYSSVLISISSKEQSQQVFGYLLYGGPSESYVNRYFVELDQLSCSYPNGTSGYVLLSSDFNIILSRVNVFSGIGDVNGDKKGDFIFGSPDLNFAYVLYGGYCGSVDISNLCDVCGFEINGMTANDNNDYHGASGMSVASAGDINNDGLGDFMIANSKDMSGKVYVIFGEQG